MNDISNLVKTENQIKNGIGLGHLKDEIMKKGAPVYLLDNEIENKRFYELFLNLPIPLERAFVLQNVAKGIELETKDDNKNIKTGMIEKTEESAVVVILYAKTNEKKENLVNNVYRALSDANIIVVLQDLRYTTRIINDLTDHDHVIKEIDRQYSESLSGAAYIDQFLEETNKKTRNKATPTGFYLLDKCLDGGLYPDLYVVGGATGSGKTTFTLNLAENIARQGKHVLMIELEMSRSELFAKIISNVSYRHAKSLKVDIMTYAQRTRDILRGGKDNESSTDGSIRKGAIEEFSKHIARNIYIEESVGSTTVKDIESALKHHISHTKQLPVVIIDYLQILSHEDKYLRSNDKAKTDANIVALKQLSRDYNVPIFIVSSLNRESYKDITEEINLTSFKESGAIEFTASVVLGIQSAKVTDARINGDTINEAKRKEIRDASYQTPKEVDIKILKNRHGESNKIVRYNLYLNFNHYEESKLVERSDDELKQERKRKYESFD